MKERNTSPYPLKETDAKWGEAGMGEDHGIRLPNEMVEGRSFFVEHGRECGELQIVRNVFFKELVGLEGSGVMNVVPGGGGPGLGTMELTDGDEGDNGRTLIRCLFGHMDLPCGVGRHIERTLVLSEEVGQGRRPEKRDTSDGTREQGLDRGQAGGRVQDVPTPDFTHPLHRSGAIGAFNVDGFVHFTELEKASQEDDGRSCHTGSFVGGIDTVHVDEAVQGRGDSGVVLGGGRRGERDVFPPAVLSTIQPGHTVSEVEQEFSEGIGGLIRTTLVQGLRRGDGNTKMGHRVEG